MASGAIGTEIAFMDVISDMAGNAAGVLALERTGLMAIGASDDRMLADQRKQCEIMIETEIGEPIDLGVAARAILTERTLVRIIFLVAVVTTGVLLLGLRPWMTSLAG